MTTLAALLVVAAFGYAVYHYLPKGAERAFRLERFHPGTPMSDWSSSYYENHRQYADLAAIYGRNDVPETASSAGSAAPEVEQPPAAESVAQPSKPQVVQHICDTRSADIAARKATSRENVRRLGATADSSTLGSKAS